MKNDLKFEIEHHNHPNLSKWAQTLSGGSVIISQPNDFNIIVSDKSNSLYGKAVGFTVPTNELGLIYLINEVKRDSSTAGLGEGLGTFIAYCGLLALVEWAKQIDHKTDFLVGINTPPDRYWGKLREVFKFDEDVQVNTGRGSEVYIPVKKY